MAYRARNGWNFEWASSYESELNTDLGFSSSLEHTLQAIGPNLDQLPPVVARNAAVAGTDIYGYLTNCSASPPSRSTPGPSTRRTPRPVGGWSS